MGKLGRICVSMMPAPLSKPWVWTIQPNGWKKSYRCLTIKAFCLTVVVSHEEVMRENYKIKGEISYNHKA